MKRKPKKENWPPKIPRVLPPKLNAQLSICSSNPEKVMFLDIETTGLSHYYDEITVVGWSLGGKACTFIKGEDPSELMEAAQNAVAVVTFNGIRFDQRFLKLEFPEISLPENHIDLLYLCRRVKLTGGQKAIENELDLNFREDLADVDGFAAVLLWHRYLRGEIDALEKLIRYNRADIAAMGALFDVALERLSYVPDLFGEVVKFEDWSAPENWNIPPADLKPATPTLTKALSFAEIFGTTAASRARVVGIDLTGSEARATGWCLLEGRQATTDTISTDDKLIERSLSSKPDMISIDSPLCLPFGRLTVDDDDPGRDEFGIMRQCERELKRRGVNVYPSLLPSMQKLTARGIRLANVFREKGVAVIESYPGAAQDIMRIPRKGAGERWLKVGLGDFGITGDFLKNDVTHDELDAITSAIVGTFHLANLSEELGSTEEPPLIIPELKARPKPIVIGISGPIAAGKTTIAEILKDNGFAYTRFSLVIDDILDERGLEKNRINRQLVGAELNETGRQRELAERTLKKVEGTEKIVVDGLRFPEDHAFLVENYGFQFMHIFADAKKNDRKRRYITRLGKSAILGKREFEEASKSNVEEKVMELKTLAPNTFFNDLRKDEIEQQILELVTEYYGENSCQSQ